MKYRKIAKNQIRSQIERIFAAVDGIERAFDKDLSGIEFDLTRPQLKTLLSIFRDNGLSMGELGRQTGYPTSALTGIVDRLLRKKLVRRIADENDRRVVKVIASAKGMELIRDFQRKLLRRTAAVLDKISDPEREKMILMVEKIADGFGRGEVTRTVKKLSKMKKI